MWTNTFRNLKMLPAPSCSPHLLSESCQVPAVLGTGTEWRDFSALFALGNGGERKPEWGSRAWRSNLTKGLQDALKPCLFQLPAQNYSTCQFLRFHTQTSNPTLFCCPKDFWLAGAPLAPSSLRRSLPKLHRMAWNSRQKDHRHMSPR